MGGERNTLAGDDSPTHDVFALRGLLRQTDRMKNGLTARCAGRPKREMRSRLRNGLSSTGHTRRSGHVQRQHEIAQQLDIWMRVVDHPDETLIASTSVGEAEAISFASRKALRRIERCAESPTLCRQLHYRPPWFLHSAVSSAERCGANAHNGTRDSDYSGKDRLKRQGVGIAR